MVLFLLRLLLANGWAALRFQTKPSGDVDWSWSAASLLLLCVCVCVFLGGGLLSCCRSGSAGGQLPTETSWSFSSPSSGTACSWWSPASSWLSAHRKNKTIKTHQGWNYSEVFNSFHFVFRFNHDATIYVLYFSMTSFWSGWKMIPSFYKKKSFCGGFILFKPSWLGRDCQSLNISQIYYI